jgi:hypothetical protein
MKTRDDILALARTKCGLGIGPDKTPEQRDGYIKFLFPFDSAAAARQMAWTMQSCGIAMCGYWRDLGFNDARLTKPYAQQIGAAVSNVQGIALKNGAWRTPKTHPADSFKPGDAVIVGTGLRTHVLLVEEYDPRFASEPLVSIDGGQGSTGTFSIERRQRWVTTVDIGGAQLLYVFNDAMFSAPDREIIGWVDFDTLSAAIG